MKQASEKLIDLSNDYSLLYSLVKKAGLCSLVVLGPHSKEGELSSFDMLLGIKNPSFPASRHLDTVSFPELMNRSGDLKRLRSGETITGKRALNDDASGVIHWEAFPLIVAKELRLILLAFTSGPEINAEDRYFITSVLHQIENKLYLQVQVEDLMIGMTRYTRLFESAPEGIVILDKDNRIMDVNPEFERMFLFKRTKILGKKLDELIAPGHMLSEAETLTQINWQGGVVAVETQRIRRDGQLIDVSVLGVPFIEGDGNLCIYGIYRDISERIRSEKQKVKRIAFIEYMSKLSSDLINMKIDEIDQHIRSVLETVARLYSAERAFLVQPGSSADLFAITHEWAVDERFSHCQRQPVFSMAELPRYFENLKAGKVCYINRSDELLKNGNDDLAFYLDLLSTETLVYIPLFVDQEFMGYIGFDTFGRPVNWDDQAINSFKLTGQILMNARERMRNEKAIQDALQRVEASDKLKSAFLAGISHEVRTPMNHILGFIELMNEPYLTQQDRDEYLEIMRSSGTHLLRLIDGVIELALIDSGEIRINETPCDISRFMESLLIEFEGMKSEMNRNDVLLYLRIPKEFRQLVINTDEIRLRQILWNLMSNALKFTPSGKIEFGISFSDFNRIGFFVKDTGIGMEKSDLSVIFERFRRVENGISRQYGGAGLGLPICKGLATLFGGSIQVQSEKDKGSTFGFSIPYVMSSPQTGSEIQLNGSVHAFKWEEKSILMVEDDPVSMRFLTVLLLNTGANLLYASNGAEALELIAGNKVDLVLMDMKMPVMNGYEATRLIKKMYPGIPVIAQTAHAMKDDKAECFSAGCDDYLTKPIDKNKLYTKIMNLLG